MPAKKSIQKKTAKKIPAKKAKAKKIVSAQKPIGHVTHFYGKIKVAIVVFKKPIKKGTSVIFSGATTNFTQAISSMQFDHQAIETAPKNQEIGLKVQKRVREGDELYAAEE